MSSVSLDSPIGPILITAQDGALESIRIAGLGATPVDPDPETQELDRHLLREARQQLEAWFEHRLTTFDLPLPRAASERGQHLRSAIASVPYGETASYGELARQAGSGPRAVGQACRRNRFTIVIPCHRIVGARQSIGYYSGGDGIATKRWLLDHERNYQP